MHRILTNCLVSAKASAIIAEFRLPAQVHSLVADLAAKLSGFIASGMRQMLRVLYRGRTQVFNSRSGAVGQVTDAVNNRMFRQLLHGGAGLPEDGDHFSGRRSQLSRALLQRRFSFFQQTFALAYRRSGRIAVKIGNIRAAVQSFSHSGSSKSYPRGHTVIRM